MLVTNLGTVQGVKNFVKCFKNKGIFFFLLVYTPQKGASVKRKKGGRGQISQASVKKLLLNFEANLARMKLFFFYR